MCGSNGRHDMCPFCNSILRSYIEIFYTFTSDRVTFKKINVVVRWSF